MSISKASFQCSALSSCSYLRRFSGTVRKQLGHADDVLGACCSTQPERCLGSIFGIRGESLVSREWAKHITNRDSGRTLLGTYLTPHVTLQGAWQVCLKAFLDQQVQEAQGFLLDGCYILKQAFSFEGLLLEPANGGSAAETTLIWCVSSR